MGRKRTPEPDLSGTERAPLRLGVRKARNGKRFWTDDERATVGAALAANGGNVARTARQTGVPESTIRCWARGHRWPESANLRAEKSGEMAAALEEIAWGLTALMPQKATDAPLNHLVVAAGIAVDKMLLLRALPVAAPRDAGALDLSRLSADEYETFVRLAAKAGRAPAGG